MVSCRLDNRERKWKNPVCENFVMDGILSFQKDTVQNDTDRREENGKSNYAWM